MISPDALDDLGPDDRVAVLVRDRQVLLLIHRAEDSPADVRARARRDGAVVAATHMRDTKAILELVAERTRNPGGVEE